MTAVTTYLRTPSPSKTTVNASPPRAGDEVRTEYLLARGDDESPALLLGASSKLHPTMITNLLPSPAGTSMLHVDSHRAPARYWRGPRVIMQSVIERSRPAGGSYPLIEQDTVEGIDHVGLHGS